VALGDRAARVAPPVPWTVDAAARVSTAISTTVDGAAAWPPDSGEAAVGKICCPGPRILWDQEDRTVNLARGTTETGSRFGVSSSDVDGVQPTVADRTPGRHVPQDLPWLENLDATPGALDGSGDARSRPFRRGSRASPRTGCSPSVRPGTLPRTRMHRHRSRGSSSPSDPGFGPKLTCRVRPTFSPGGFRHEADVPAQQPSSVPQARVPLPDAYTRRPCHRQQPSSSRPQQAGGVTR
jgi:hypothetical protein